MQDEKSFMRSEEGHLRRESVPVYKICMSVQVCMWALLKQLEWLNPNLMVDSRINEENTGATINITLSTWVAKSGAEQPCAMDKPSRIN